MELSTVYIWSSRWLILYTSIIGTLKTSTRIGWQRWHCRHPNCSLVLELLLLTFVTRSCLFGLFSAGMAGSTTQLIYRNLSTVDSLSATLKVYQLAIHDPNPPVQPLPGHAPLVRRVWLPENPAPNQQQRCFAIVSTAPGENPWRLENTMDNFKEVLGYSLWEWWLPIKRSPLVKKDSSEGWYRWNEKLLERLRKDAGIEARGRVTT